MDRQSIKGFPIPVEEAKVIEETIGPLTDLWTIELHYYEGVRKDHYYDNRYLRGIRSLKETVVLDNKADAISVLKDWMDCPPEEELKKDYKEVDYKYKEMFDSPESFQKSWDLARERNKEMQEAIRKINDCEILPGTWLTVITKGLFDAQHEEGNEYIVISHDLSAKGKANDVLETYHYEITHEEAGV